MAREREKSSQSCNQPSTRRACRIASSREWGRGKVGGAEEEELVGEVI